MAITSVLDDTIKALPDGWKQKAQSIPNTLRKAGVKDEELKFAKIGIEEQIAKDPLKQLSKEDLLKGLENRKDKQGVEVSRNSEFSNNTDYGSITIGANPTAGYQERVYQFGLDSGEAGYKSVHFPEVPKYLAHARVQPIAINGKQTRSILEIQSDLHAGNRRGGQAGEEAMLADLNTFDEDDLLEMWGTTDRAQIEVDMTASIGRDTRAKVAAPYEKNLTTKVLEKELNSAIDEGAEYTSIPISGEAVKDLKRSSAVQRNYETSVLQTAKKVAEQNGLKWTEETGSLPSPKIELRGLEDKLDRVKEINSQLKVISNNARLADGAEMRAILDETQKLRAEWRVLEDSVGVLPGEDTTINRLFHAYANNRMPADYVEQRLMDLGKKAPEASYLVIHHPKGTKFNANLYEAGTGVAVAVGLYSALDEGVSDDQAVDYLVKNEGYSKEEASSYLTQVKQAKEAGVTKEQFGSFMQSQEVVEAEHTDTKNAPIAPKEVFKPLSPEQAASASHTTSRPADSSQQYGTPAKAAEAIRIVDNAKDFVASQSVLNPSLHTLLDTTKGFTYSSQAKQFVAQEELFQRERVQELAAKKGLEMIYDPAQGGWMVMAEGKWQPAEPGILRSLGKASVEIGGWAGGAYAGYKAGKKVANSPLGRSVPYLDKAPWLGSVVGGVVGGMVGNETDYLIEAMNTHTELDAKVQLHRLTDAAQMALVGELVGAAAMKVPSAVKSAVNTAKAIPAKLKAAADPSARVDQALSDTMFLNTAEADDLVRIMSRFSEVPGSTPTQQRVAASILTQPSGEGIVRDLGRLNPIASRSIAKTIDNRAQDLLTTVNNLTDENLGRVLSQDLGNYVTDTKTFYSNVKLEAAKAPLASQWQFNIDKVAVAPILTTFKENISTNVSDIGMRAKLMSRIKKIEATTYTRDFNDLLELRQIVNDFKYNSNITKPQDFDAVNGVIKNIDTAITAGAKQVMPNADAWLDDFAKAKYQYAQMKTVENNVMFKALSKPGIDYDSTVKTLTKYITAEDSTFTDVVKKLPKYTQAKVEGSVIRALSEKYTAGPEGGLRAVHFPPLAQALDGVTFTSKEGRKFKAAVSELAEVFRNDVQLSKVTGSIAPPTDAATIATSITGVAKRAIVAKIWNYALRGAETGTDKMIRMAADVIDKPLNTTKMKELMDELEGQVDINAEARELMARAAQEQAQKGDIGMPKVLLYGTGDTLSLKGAGTPTKLAQHRIASIEEAMKVAEAEGIARSDTKLLDAALNARGYKAIQYGADKVRLLK